MSESYEDLGGGIRTARLEREQRGPRLGFIPGAECPLHRGWPVPCPKCEREREEPQPGVRAERVPSTTVRFLRVLGIRSSTPVVIAIADDNAVKWNPRGWDCACLTDDDEFECEHIEAVRSLLDPRVIGEETP